MIQIISTKLGFEAFINFLVQEWSSEHLIFLTEYFQLKNALNLSEEFKNKLNLTLDIKTPFIDSSKYAHFEDIDDCKEFMNVIDTFYDKYIFEGAVFEINVSWNCRNSLSLLL